VFQQDEARCHKAKNTKKKLKSYLRSIGLANKIIKSEPYQKPLELIEATCCNRYPTTQKELEDFIFEEWEKTPDNIVKSLIDSMNKRIEKVTEGNGTIINY